MKNKSSTINLFWIILTGFLFTNCTSEISNQPNVLFIAIDDLRPDLGCYGNNIVHSPNLDKLASEGVFFTNHYVQVPTCGASRYSLITGMRPASMGQLSNDVIVNELSNRAEEENPESFIHQLKRNGYYTVGIGKVSHSADGLVYGYEEKPSTKRELPYSWDELIFDNGKWKTGWNAFFGYANGENRQSLKKQVKPYEAGEVNDEGYPDGNTTNLAISKLQEMKDKNTPFFMGVGFFKPHLPFNAPQKYWDLYDRDSLPISDNPNIPENINLKSLHESGEFNQYALGEEKASLSKSVSEAYARKLKHAYLASISYIDAQTGKLMQELKTSGLDKNTIVVIWGDHGWHLGDQRVWGKHTLFENALKSVLIIKAPSLQLKNNKINAIVETVDIYPSLLELCGVPLSHDVDGQSFANILTVSDITLSNNVAYSYFNNGISMRTERYRLTKYFREEQPTIELYDHFVDSLETRNIANEHPDLVNELLPTLNVGLAKFKGFEEW